MLKQSLRTKIPTLLVLIATTVIAIVYRVVEAIKTAMAK